MSLFAPPKELQTQVFSQIPDVFLKHVESDWVRANKPGQKVTSFLEGPSFDKNGNLFVTDIPFGRIFKISPEGQWDLIAEYDGWPNGLKIHNDGRIFIADYKNGIMQLDPNTGVVSPFLTHRKSESFKGVFSYDMNKDHLECLINNAPSPNGLVMDYEEKALFVAMTRGNAVWRLPIQKDGSTTKVGIFTALAGGLSGADGLALDADKNLYVCDAGQACVWVFNQYAEPLYRIKSCAGRTITNLAFGGHENKQLFMIDSSTGSILTKHLEHSGKPMFSHH
jgi:gluconolactonase